MHYIRFINTFLFNKQQAYFHKKKIETIFWRVCTADILTSRKIRINMGYDFYQHMVIPTMNYINKRIPT